MRNAILAIAIAFLLAAPSAASAEDKHKDWIELQSYSHQVSQPATSSSRIKNLGIFKRTPDKVESHSENTLTGKGTTVTNAPSALKSQNLLNGAGSPTGRATIKVSPEYTRH